MLQESRSEGRGAETSRAAASRGLDRPVGWLVRLLLRIFFRRVERAGVERFPPAGPLLVVANHVNGLIDPLLILGTLPRPARFLGKHTLWRNPALRPWLELGGVIPIYRAKDDAAAQGKNDQVFARCHELLAAGGAVALFPEGTSHSEPALVPLRTGAARIVLEAERKFPGLGVRVVPVGLSFDEKERFRSRALVLVGEPIDPAPFVRQAAGGGGGQDGEVAAVRGLTARIEQDLKRVTLNYGSWDEARLLGQAAELFAASGSADGGEGSRDLVPPAPGPLARRFALDRAFIEGYGELRQRAPERTAAVAAAVARYRRLLAAFGLRDGQVTASYRLSPVARFTLRTLRRLVLHLPLAAIGTLLNWPTYRLVGWIAGRVQDEPDQPATYKVFAGIVLFPLTWVLEAVTAAWLVHRHLAGLVAAARAGTLPGAPPASAWEWTWGAGVLVLAAAMAGGWAALRFQERGSLFWREARAFLVLRSGSRRLRLTSELEARRAEAAAGVADLAALYQSWHPAEAKRES